MEIVKLKSKGKNMNQIILLPKESYENKRKGIEHGEQWDMDDVEKYIDEHKNELFKKGKAYAINTLLPRGWRKATKTENYDGKVQHITRKIYPEETEAEGYVYAVSIIEF